MTKWKLFKKSKTKETGIEVEMIAGEAKETKKHENTRPPLKEEEEKIPIKEYQETLYSKDVPPKKRTAQDKEKKEPLKRTSWESAGIIERNVDAMGKEPTDSTGSGTQGNNTVDKKVDRILSKKKIEQ